jgi:hypothetical protein
MDNLIACTRCEGDACYENIISPEVRTYFCYGCGFISNSVMKENSEFLNEQMEILPELYKELTVKDEESGMIWMPSMVNIPDKGMIFADGTSSSNWKWASVKAIPVKEEEKTKYPIPGKKDEYYQWRMDMSTMKHFDEKDFIEALDYLGVFSLES